jgi:hypothetical protein
MSNQTKSSVDSDETPARREFLRQVGKATVTAPAVALLLSASTNPALAQYRVTAQPRHRTPRSSGVTEVEVGQ